MTKVDELAKKGFQTHHISYDPEITVDILRRVHEKFHGHGVGIATGEIPKSKKKDGIGDDIYPSGYSMTPQGVKIWKCACGQAIKSLYPKQLEANKQAHLTSHKLKGETE